MSMTVKPRHSNKKFSRYRRYFSWRVTFWASINSKVKICEGCNFCHLPRNVPHVETFVPLQFMKKTFDQRKNCVIYHIPDYIAKSFANSSLLQFLSNYNYEFFVVLLAKRNTRIKIQNFCDASGYAFEGQSISTGQMMWIRCLFRCKIYLKWNPLPNNRQPSLYLMSFCSLPNVQNKVLPKPFPKTTNDVLNGISLTIIYRIAVVDTLLNARTCLCSSISRIFLKETETSTSTGFPEIIKIPIKGLQKTG